MITEKKCTTCGETKPLAGFTTRAASPDGRYNQCLTCRRELTRRWRASNKDRVREYEAAYYAANKDRINAQSRAWMASPLGRASRRIFKKRWDAENPKKRRAHALVTSARNKGHLIPQPCERCGATKTVAHHDDYAKPYDVRWLCQSRHRQLHAEEKRAMTK